MYQIIYASDEMDIDRVVNFILASYWGKDLNRVNLIKAINNSFCAGLFLSKTQIGFARVISDGYTSAYIRDFFVFQEFQGCGNGLRLWKALLNHPNLSDVRRWYLGTKDSHGFYEKCGFEYSP